MGLYINPSNMTKEEWLTKNGKAVFSPSAPNSETMSVCVVDNGFFTAAAVLYSEREMQDFNAPEDHRPKVWFDVPISELRAVCPDFDRYVK